MRARRMLIPAMPRFIALLACLLLSTYAWSQYGSDRGDWQILQARYGTADRNIDVTQTLRELAQQDSSFRITNKTFGNDPAPGVVKTLRIFARGPGGTTRTFEYRENDIVDGNVFTGWKSGNWGHGGWQGGWGDEASDPQRDHGRWQILQARYGTADRNIDVTRTLRSLAQQDNTFRITNRTFGNDPAPGVVKTLRIYARGAGGATRTFEYRENDIVDGNVFTGWRGGNWGHGGWQGGWGEHASDQQGDRGEWQILQARYGTADRNVDVTPTLRNLARQDGAIRVTNQTFGNDPAPGVIKTLRIYARGPGGATRTFEYGENHIVNGAMFTGWSSGAWGQGDWNDGWGHDNASGVPHGGVTIVSAQYGEGPDRRDVTSRLRSMVRDGTISMRVNNETMGADPAPGRQKTLWLTYYAGGQGQRNVTVYENGQLTLP